jgi:hypothetical protein
MKWLAMLLLLANLAVLGWGLQREAVDLSPRPTKHAGVGNLKLLSEVLDDNGQVAEPEPEIAANHSGRADEVQSDRPNVSSSVSVAGQTNESAVNSVNESQSPAQAVSEEKREADALLPRDSRALSEPDVVPRETAIPEKVKPPVVVCGAFGPFDRGAAAREVAESLASQGMDSSLRRESMEKPIGYWVIIPPLGSQEGAIDKVRQLKESGISDIRRFVKGDQRNGISLGVFSSKENAELRRQEVVKKGHAARVIPRLITVPTYWIDYRASQESAAKAVKSLSQKNEAIKNEEYPCSRVVTSGGIF